jgi:hypothetical protein
MSIWEIIWVLFVAICFVALVVSACTADERREHYDTPCFRNIAICITGFILLCYFVGATREPYVPDPKFFTIWNRSGQHHSKAGWQITNYRRPAASLEAAEYMMGVEMARSNACSAFNFSREEDISLFHRCAHFFPEFYDIYRTHHQATVGVPL